ncbi:MAG: VOC family protein [Elusimicrobia bacterium]|nr:VOC family protein [Elusimicrobiota bacterium]
MSKKDPAATVPPNPTAHPSHHSLIPYLVVRDAARAINFYKKAFGAIESLRLDAPDGKVMHADLKIGICHVMLAEENSKTGTRSPVSFGCPVMLYLYVEDVDRAVDRALKAGAKLSQPVKDQYYGDRAGSVEDGFGYVWFLATHKEDVPKEEMQRRAAKLRQ